MGGSTSTTYPGPTPQEQELEQMQLEDLKQQRTDIESFKPFVLQQYGLTSFDVANPEYTALADQLNNMQTNPGDYKVLKHNVDGHGTDETKTSAAYDALKAKLGGTSRTLTQYTYTPEQAARNKKLQDLQDQALELQRLQGDRQKQALAGTLPLSQQLLQQRDKDFQLLKEDQSRNGNEIVGDSFENAAAKTTSGQQALESLRKTYGLLGDSEMNAVIQQAALPSVYAAQYQATSGNLPGTPNAAMFALNPSYYSSAMQPYQFSRQGQFQSDSANAANNQSFNNALLTGLLGGASRLGAAAIAA